MWNLRTVGLRHALTLAMLAALPERAVAAPTAHPKPALAFTAQNAGRPWNYRRTGDEQRFEVRRGDQIEGDGTEAKERSEVYLRGKSLDTGRTYTLAFRFMIERGPVNTAKWLLLAQLQSNFDKGEPGHSPPLAIGLGGDDLVIVSRASSAKISAPGDTVYTKQYSSPRPIARGTWHKIAVKVHFDPFGNGLLAVTLDGRSIVDYAGAIGFNDDVGPYLKLGIYRATAAEPLAVRYKAVSIVP
jgi:hypothetical protein